MNNIKKKNANTTMGKAIGREMKKLNKQVKGIKKDKTLEVERNIVSYAKGEAGFAKNQILEDMILRTILTFVAPGVLSIEDEEPIRYNTGFIKMPTVVCLPFEEDDVAFKTSGLSPIGSSYAAVFRDPIRNHIFLDPNVSLLPYSYQQRWLITSLTSTTSSATVNLNFFVDQIYKPPISRLDATSNYKPHGPSLGCAVVDYEPDQYYVFMDVGATYTVTAVLTGTSTVTVAAQVTYSDGLSDDEEQELNFGLLAPGVPSVQPFVATATGYYTFSYSSIDGTVGTDFVTLSAVLSGNGAVSCHRMHPSFLSLAPSVQSLRINGTTFKYTNTSSDLHNSGQVVGYQTPKNKHWFNDYVNNGFDQIAGLNGSQVLPAKTGMYMFSKPAGDIDVALQTDFNVTANELIRTRFPIISPSPILMCYITTGDGNNSTGKWRFEYSSEFETQNVLLGKACSQVNSLFLEQALEHIGEMNQIYENPLHLKQIWDSIKGVIPDAIDALVPISGQFAPLTKIAAGLSRKLLSK